MMSFAAGPIIVVIVAGLITAVILDKPDDKWGVTDTLVSYIESALQEMMGKSREIQNKTWD